MGTLFVDNIKHQSSQGSGTITVGASGEKVDLGTGVTGGTLTNTPSFRVHPSSGQTVSNASWTKVTFDTETWDTDSAFASNKYTCPSGKDGKYVFSYGGYFGSAVDQKIIAFRLYKNGSAFNRTYVQQSNSGTSGEIPNASVVMSLVAGDYVEVYVYQNNGGDRTLDSNYTRFEGYRLIGI